VTGGALVAITTAPSEAVAEQLAVRCVEAGLAACVNVLPGLRSIYRWNGVLQREAECLLLIKTTEARFEELGKLLVEEHPYELPELVALAVTAGHAPYVAWLLASVSGGGGSA